MVAAPHNNHGAVADEIEGLLTVYEDGHVERALVMPTVARSTSPLRGPGDVTWRDVTLCLATGLWARLFVPDADADQAATLPVVVYFHGGGFCVGSAAWRCYHDFAARLASTARCAVASVEYRLAPEHPLPAAYDDAVAAVNSLLRGGHAPQKSDVARLEPRCDPSRVVLCGDSAGGAIAYHAAARLCAGHAEPPGWLRGVALVQPFFGGEARTASEAEAEKAPSPSSVLSVERSDGYWRLALPRCCDRDHPWCNPAGSPRLAGARLPPTLVCAAEADILRDRSAEFCAAVKGAGNCIDSRVYCGVGHAFQVLGKSHASKVRTCEMLMHIRDFIWDHV